jgi:hypothetical protein
MTCAIVICKVSEVTRLLELMQLRLETIWKPTGKAMSVIGNTEVTTEQQH